MRTFLLGISLCLALFCIPTLVFANDLSPVTDSNLDGIPDSNTNSSSGGSGITIQPASMLVDRAHGNSFNIGGLVSFLLGEGWTVDELNSPLTPEILQGYDVYLIPTSLGSGSSITPYTPDEAMAVLAFVEDGHGLWCFSEYSRNPSGVNSVAAQFGIDFKSGMIIDPVENIDGNQNWPLITMIESHPITEGVNSFGYYAGCCVGTTNPAVVVASGGANAASSECPNFPPVLAVYQNGGRAVFCGDITPLYPNYDISDEHWLMLANTAEWLATYQTVATETMNWNGVKSLYRDATR